MQLTPELLIALLNFGVKFGIDAAVAIGQALSGGSKTIDDAIAALQLAKTKTAAQYVQEAQAALGTAPVTPPAP